MKIEIYSIDKELSQKEGSLVIRAGEGECDGFALKAFKQKQLLTVPYSQGYKTLQQLAEKGKLYFQQRQLVIDLYGRTPFHFKVAPANDGKLTVSGWLTINGQEVALQECDFLCPGSPHWFIKGISLKFLDDDISWTCLKQILDQPCTLSPESVRELLYDDGEALGKIIFLENSKELLHQSQDPFPVLMLKDRTGAFAELWMDYGNERRVAFHDQSKNSFKRQRESEIAWEKDLLETDFIRKISGTSHYYCPLDKVAKSLAFLLELGWQIIDCKDNRVMHQSNTELSMNCDEQYVSIKGKVKYENFTVDVKDVLGAFNRRERFVQLGSGVVGLLPQQLEQSGLSGLEECEIIGNDLKIQKNQIGTLSSLWDSENIKMDGTLLDLREKLKSFQGISQSLPGNSFKGTLRPYQQEGVNWLAFLHAYGFHGMLADDMGLGKTVQVLAFLSQLKEIGKTLIVMPTSLLFNWKREIERFLDCPVYIHQGQNREINQWPENGIILTSFTTLRIDLHEFKKVLFENVIVDEAQAIKNAHTQISQAICALNTRFRLSITGTPIENNLKEMWSHFKFLMPDLLGSEKDFESSVETASVDARHLQRIKKKLRPFILRRTKEVVKLPERIDQVVWIDMEESQRRIYEEFLAGVRGNLFKKVEVDGMAKHRMEVLEAILRLRQICCHPLLVSAHLEADNLVSSAKLNTLLNDLETILGEGSKAIVYSQFTSMLKLIGKALKERGWNYITLDGSTVDREKVVMQFQDDPTAQIFLVSLKAGGVGLNLTAGDYVFLFDPWWNEAVEEQAINRAHRIGRHATVFTKRLVIVESIEEKIMKLKEAKRGLVDSILDDEMQNKNLTEEDFRFLLF